MYTPLSNKVYSSLLRYSKSPFFEKVRLLLKKEMTAAKVSGKVVGRSKHLYGIYKKMEQQKLDFKDLYDLTGVRVQTTSLKDCYAVLGLVHSLWKPIPGRFKDYIAMPKSNLYQSYENVYFSQIKLLLTAPMASGGSGS